MLFISRYIVPSKYFLFILIIFCVCYRSNSQGGYGNNWILGYDSEIPNIKGSLLSFSANSIEITGINKSMVLEGSNTSISNYDGILQFYSNGCYINDSDNQKILNSDSIGLGVLSTSYCNTGGNPLNQSIIALPIQGDNNIYYLFYPDLESPYRHSKENYFALAPLHLYYSVVDMSKNDGKGEVTIKNSLVISDTLARGMIQATSSNTKDCWWIIMPESHSNCYYIIRLSINGIDTILHQCLGEVWGDRDLTGQAVFSPNGKKYVRFNYFYGLNIYDFDDLTGRLSSPINIKIPIDTFYYSGVAISPNSRYIYATTFDKLFQLDLNSSDSLINNTLIAELNTPQDIQFKTRFNHAVLAADGKIYIGGTNTHNYLHVIQSPNCGGQNCDLQQYAVKMPSWNIYGMPNQPTYNDWGSSNVCDSIVGTLSIKRHEFKTKIFPSPFYNNVQIEVNEPVRLTILDIFGRIVYGQELNKNINNVFLQHLNTGVYFFLLSNKYELVVQRKLIKL